MPGGGDLPLSFGPTPGEDLGQNTRRGLHGDGRRLGPSSRLHLVDERDLSGIVVLHLAHLLLGVLVGAAFHRAGVHHLMTSGLAMWLSMKNFS